MTDHEIDLMNRELCTDGACIGVIGPDGRCNECGLVSSTVTQHPRNRGMVPTSGSEVDEAEQFGGEQRELCPDGACIGIIGPDGRCKECGLQGIERAESRTAAASGSGSVEQAVASAEEAGESESAASESDGEDEFDHRELCPDGACIGLIGPDGRCKECGIEAAGDT